MSHNGTTDAFNGNQDSDVTNKRHMQLHRNNYYSYTFVKWYVLRYLAEWVMQPWNSGFPQTQQIHHSINVPHRALQLGAGFTRKPYHLPCFTHARGPDLGSRPCATQHGTSLNGCQHGNAFHQRRNAFTNFGANQQQICQTVVIWM